LVGVICSICGSTTGTTVRTYKHDWWTCDRCGTTRRTRRNGYPLAWVPIPLLRPIPDVIEDERHFYDYYREASAGDVSATKWAGQIDTLTTRLSDHGIEWANHDVLDISGGPGFVTKHIAQTARRAVVTEFSPEAVEGMNSNLGVEAVKFDYQTDRIRDVVSGQFDLVLIDYSINFCLDLASFVRSLAEVIRPGGQAYVSFVHPTFGCFLRWQFDEYTYNALYRPETMDKAFSGAGFEARDEMSDPAYDYRATFSMRRRLISDPIALWYRARAPRSGYDRSLKQRSSVRLYQRV
jgi:SAM-dependent methyltransferase